ANVTRVGVRKGKAAYMSPEQCRGDPLDRRTDIWSLGVVIYEMLTMARLYRADTDLAIMHRIVSQDVPAPSTVVPDIPRALEAIVLRCLSRDREHRFASALELQHALESCARELNLAPGAVALGGYVRGIYGSPPLPWHSGSMSASAPVTSSIDVAIDSSPNDATRDLVSAPPPQQETAIGPPPAAPRVTAPYPSATRRAAGAGFTQRDASSSASVDDAPARSKAAVVIAIAAIGLLVGGIAWWQVDRTTASPSDTPTTASAPTPPPVEIRAPITASTPVGTPVPPTSAELEAWLAAVHQTDATRALPFPARHVLLEKLAASSAAARVDHDLQAALDLRQAEAAREPCRTFATALDRIAATLANDPRPSLLDAIADVKLPDPARTPAAGRAPDASCEGLAARLAALRPSTATGADAAAGSESAAEKPRKPRKTATPTADAKPDTTSSAKLDDELRPFKK
ncbi:MAG TPA: protein kinase, partial [Nannocystaceae bacterium]|nr:protein kinase [Nannocystaceae bacterium]